jgi:ATP-dependent DNA helicase DinG
MSDFHELFGSDGPLARAIPGFTTRREQIEMAEFVAEALETGGRLIVEAGTGTGKTFAYLVPVLLSDKHVIVSTGTRTLQDQLFHRDLPAVAAALGRPAKIALLKGRANYLCLYRLELAEQQLAMRDLSHEVATSLNKVRAWAPTTIAGEIAELSHVSESDPVWPLVTSTRENCLGPDCTMFKRCHVVQARAQAQAADVVVVNHHLLLADLVLKETGFGDLLPGADAIVIDEAHQLPEIAANFLGFAVSRRQLEALARDVSSELMKSVAGADVAINFATQIDRELAELHYALGPARERLPYDEWPSAVFELLDTLRRSLDALSQALEDPAKHQPAMAALKRRADEQSERLHEIVSNEAADSPASVRWASVTAHSMAFHYVPIDVSEQLGELIESRAKAWTFTSATLAVGDDFTHFSRRLGVQHSTAALFGSPFDYAQQALLYLPRGLDAPASPRHTQQVIEAAWPVLEASGGRAFLLFTSHRALREAAVLLERRVGPRPPFPILVQGTAPREALLTRFREAGNAVLLGTSSFWEGVDVKGDALSVVVIDKLPFAAPDDPVLKARLDAIERRGGNPFFEEQVPQAVITLKQGVGRLIRDSEDFGVIMLCDQRLRTRGYGRIFIDSLPPMTRTEKLDDVTRFLKTKLEAIGRQVGVRTDPLVNAQ